jgi:isocitrate lyase
MVWCETSKPGPGPGQTFAEGIHDSFPDKLLAYNCSPSFNWKANLDDATIATFQRELGAMGYKFQFVTLAGFHALNLGMFDLAMNYRKTGMLAYSRFQEEEFRFGKEDGYMATTHQKFVGAGDRLFRPTHRKLRRRIFCGRHVRQHRRGAVLCPNNAES